LELLNRQPENPLYRSGNGKRELYSMDDLCYYLQVTKSTVYQHIKKISKACRSGSSA